MTDAEADKFYHTTRWKKKREWILKRDHYECQLCKARIQGAAAKGIILPAGERRIRRAYTVHHVIELKAKPELCLDDDNLISVCRACHDKIHGRDAEALKQYQFPKKKRTTEEKW